MLALPREGCRRAWLLLAEVPNVVPIARDWQHRVTKRAAARCGWSAFSSLGARGIVAAAQNPIASVVARAPDGAAEEYSDVHVADDGVWDSKRSQTHHTAQVLLAGSIQIEAAERASQVDYIVLGCRISVPVKPSTKSPLATLSASALSHENCGCGANRHFCKFIHIDRFAAFFLSVSLCAYRETHSSRRLRDKAYSKLQTL